MVAKRVSCFVVVLALAASLAAAADVADNNTNSSGAAISPPQGAKGVSLELLFNSTFDGVRAKVVGFEAQGVNASGFYAALAEAEAERPALLTAIAEEDDAAAQAAYSRALKKLAGIEEQMLLLDGRLKQTSVVIQPECAFGGNATALDSSGNSLAVSDNSSVIFSSGGDGVSVRFPVELQDGGVLGDLESPDVLLQSDILRITLRNPAGSKMGELVAEMQPVLGNGGSAQGRVNQLRLMTSENAVRVDLGGMPVQASASLNVELARVPPAGELDVAVLGKAPEEVRLAFEELVGKNGFTVLSAGPAVVVNETGFREGDAGKAVVRIGVGKEWVDSIGNAQVKMFRFDKEAGVERILDTQVAGERDSMRFFQAAADGLSAFALYAVVPVEGGAAAGQEAGATPVQAVGNAAASNSGGAGGGFDSVTAAAGVLLVLAAGAGAYFLALRLRKKEEPRILHIGKATEAARAALFKADEFERRVREKQQ